MPEVTDQSEKENSANSERGRQSYLEGHSFEASVAELYRLLHYSVELGRLFSGRQVDLFLSGQWGDMAIYRAIECKSGPVKADHIDSFIAKLRLVRCEYPSAQGTIISAVSFTDAIKSQAAREGIQLTLYRDLAAQLLDGNTYAKNIIRDYETSERYPKDLYIEPYISHEVISSVIPAFRVIDEWLANSEWKQLTLLGDVGTGKSFLSRTLAYRLANTFLEKPYENPLPILIDLRNADRQFSLEGLVLTHLQQSGLEKVSFEAFQYSLRQGSIVLILDGFDEMAARVTPQVTNRNFHELARCVKGRAKVLLTCRTHYFKSRTEEEEIVLGSHQDYGSETARDLFWELIARKGFRITYLRPFETPQIEEYIRRAKGQSARQAIVKIRQTYNLMELSQRPLLLDMIVKSIDKLNSDEINPATLYKVYTDAWVHRDQWRDILSPESKLALLMALAVCLWQEEAPLIHHSRLIDYVKSELALLIQNPQQLVEIDSEVRTASFLTRDYTGNYSFAHKSHIEYFVSRHIALELSQGNYDCLYIKRLSPEVIQFLKFQVDLDSIVPMLEKILRNEYRPQVSENALLCLYSFRRDQYLSSPESLSGEKPSLFSVAMPTRMKLKGAQLDQVTLEGAEITQADLRDANLNQAILKLANLSDSVLAGANLEKADISGAILRGTDLSATNIRGANLTGSNIASADFSNSDLTESQLLELKYIGARFTGARFLNALLSDELKKYVGIVSDKTLINVFSEIPEVALNREDLDQIYLFVRRLAGKYALGARLESDPDDIASDVILRLLNGRIELGGMDSARLYPYLSTVVRGLHLERLRSRSDRFLSLDELETTTEGREKLSQVLDDKPSPLEILLREESTADEEVLLREYEKILSEEYWRVVKARYLDGLSVSEIATRERKHPTTVRRMITKSLEILRKNTTL